MTAKTILIVEDEAIIAMDLRHQLEVLGYPGVRTTQSAEEALQLVARIRPALVLMDIRLQGAMDGIEAATLIAREYRVPVVFLTSHSDPLTVQRAAQSAAYGYVTKPFRIDEIRAAIEIALAKAAMELRLREADRWFAATLRCVQDGVVVAGVDARIRFLNPAAESLLGRAAAEVIGRDIEQIVRFAPSPSDAAPAPGVAARALEEGHVVGVEHARRLVRGSAMVVVDASAGPIDDELGQRLGVALVLRDASERVQREEQLRASEQRFRSAFDFAPLGMALVSLDGRFLQVNDALCRLLGCDAEWLRERLQAEVTVAADFGHEVESLHRLLTQAEPVVQFEKRYLRRDAGREVSALVSASLLQEGAEPTCFLYQVHDLTEQKKAAEQLAQIAAERMHLEADELAAREKSRFMARASHEMRTPLNAVLGFAELLQMQQAVDSPKTREFAGYIVQAGRHLLAMVNDILDLQRGAGGELKLDMTSVGVDECVRETVQLLAPMATERGIDLSRVDIGAGLRVSADATRLRQVLLNLGSNAVKYSRPGGSVSFSARFTPAGRILITVTDTGIGMTPDQQQRLFQPFERLGQERSATPGVGLGLVIARNLVERMGGTIRVTSAPRQGTSVDVELDAAG